MLNIFGKLWTSLFQFYKTIFNFYPFFVFSCGLSQILFISFSWYYLSQYLCFSFLWVDIMKHFHLVCLKKIKILSQTLALLSTAAARASAHVITTIINNIIIIIIITIIIIIIIIIIMITIINVSRPALYYIYSVLNTCTALSDSVSSVRVSLGKFFFTTDVIYNKTNHPNQFRAQTRNRNKCVMIDH